MKVIQRLLELQELEKGPKAAAPEARRSAETIRKEIPEQILAHYDRLVARGKKGVVLVRRATGVCTGCQMKLASGNYAALLRNDDIAMCDTCGRYLVIEPEPPASAAPVPSAPPKAAPNKRRKKTVADGDA